MLPKVNRLKSDKDFKNVFRKGKTLENQFFRVKFLKNQKNFSRFGFIVGVKLLKRAAQRNILKRRLRALCRSMLKDLKSNFDIVIWPKTNSAYLSYKDLANYLYDLLSF